MDDVKESSPQSHEYQGSNNPNIAGPYIVMEGPLFPFLVGEGGMTPGLVPPYDQGP